MAARAVILVRHGLPEARRDTPSTQWAVSSDFARRDVEGLAGRLPPSLAGPIWTSDERKALDTAEIVAGRLGFEVAVNGGLAEVRRPEIWDEDYRAVAVSYLGGACPSGWEPRDSVTTRFAAAVHAACDGAPSRAEIAVVDHGLAMSLYLQSVAPTFFDGGPTFALRPFWEALTFPDAWRLDLESREIVRL